MAQPERIALMFLDIHQRPSDSSYIDLVWSCRSNGGGTMTSIASSSWDLVFWDVADHRNVTVHGPETHATTMHVPEGATFFGITFAIGSVLPHLAPPQLVDTAIDIPDATGHSFYLAGTYWRRPDDESAEQLVARLVHEDVVVRDRLVVDQLLGASTPATKRTIQRRFRAATGLTQGTVRQIERARHAAVLLQDGHDIADVVHGLGYYDGPHLRRSLNRFVGRTPPRLSSPEPTDQMSLLYTT